MSPSRRTALGLACTLLVAAAAAPLLPRWAGFLVTIAIAKALVALGLLLLMRTGLVSFGQGLYFAIGAYAAGVGANALELRDAVPMVLLGAIAAGLAALVLGTAAGPVSHDLLRHAQPGVLHDPLWTSREDLGPRLD